MKLHVAIALGLAGGLLFGLLAALTDSPTLIAAAEGVEPLGIAFINLLKMVVIPLVGTTLFVGVAGMGDLKRLTRMGAYTLLFFAVTTLVAVVLGMGTMRLMLPLASEAAARAVEATAPDAAALPGPVEFLVGLIPANPFKAAADGALLPLIVFTVLFGAATGTLPFEDRKRLVGLATSVSAALIKLVQWILWIAPFGVFALAAPVTARSGWAMLQSLGVFVMAVLVGLTVFIVCVYLPTVRLLGRMEPDTFLRACLGPQIIAFTTTSSAATIPAMLEAADEQLHLVREVSSFVIPLGASINRAGSALFQGCGVIFLAWLYGVQVPAAGLGVAVLATALVSITVASVPAASVLSLAPALGVVGIPLDGMGVLLGVDRIPDMARTATNVTGHMSAAVVMDRAERGTGGIPEL
jgi:DAACS family dicarboxylate/amino acid:cation (Na+ or H+) symporter